MASNKNKFRLLTFVSYVFVLAVFIYLASLKRDFHIDELFSYTLSNSWLKGFSLPQNSWVNSTYINDILTSQKNKRFNYEMVYLNQVADVHPPLYYYIFHTVSSFVPGVFSKWIGLGINLVIHLLIMVEIGKITNKICQNKLLALTASLAWGLSVAGLASGVFIRMYHLLTLIGLVLVRVLLEVLASEQISVKLVIKLALTYLLGCLTHYYFYLWAGFMSLVVILILIKDQSWPKLKGLITTGLLGVLGAVLYFPAVFHHLTGTNRGNEFLTNLQDQSIWTNLEKYLDFISNDLFLGIGPVWVGLILVGLLIYYSWRAARYREYPGFINILTSLIYLLLVQQVSHYTSARYIYLIYPSIIISLVVLGKNFKWKKLLHLALVSLAVVGLDRKLPANLYLNRVDSTQLVASAQTTPALVISDLGFRVMSELDEYRAWQEVYSINSKDLSTIKLPDISPNQDQVILYLMGPWEKDQELIKKIKNKYQFTQIQELKEVPSTKVYLLSR